MRLLFSEHSCQPRTNFCSTLTQQHEKSCQCSSPRGHPELTDDQVDSWQQSRPKKGWKKSQASHWDMVRVGHPYLVETEVALV